MKKGDNVRNMEVKEEIQEIIKEFPMFIQSIPRILKKAFTREENNDIKRLIYQYYDTLGGAMLSIWKITQSIWLIILYFILFWRYYPLVLFGSDLTNIAYTFVVFSLLMMTYIFLFTRHPQYIFFPVVNIIFLIFYIIVTRNIPTMWLFSFILLTIFLLTKSFIIRSGEEKGYGIYRWEE